MTASSRYARSSRCKTAWQTTLISTEVGLLLGRVATIQEFTEVLPKTKTKERVNTSKYLWETAWKTSRMRHFKEKLEWTQNSKRRNVRKELSGLAIWGNTWVIHGVQQLALYSSCCWRDRCWPSASGMALLEWGGRFYEALNQRAGMGWSWRENREGL